MKKNKYNLFNTRKSKKLEKDFLKTNIGKAMFVVLTVGIISIILGFGITIFEIILFLTNNDIKEFSFLIGLGTAAVITGLICNIVYFIAYAQFRNNK